MSGDDHDPLHQPRPRDEQVNVRLARRAAGPGQATEHAPRPWAGWSARHRDRRTARAQRRLDARQLRRARRDRARNRRRDRRARAWARFAPHAIITAAVAALVTAGLAMGLLLDSGTRPVGVGLVFGGLFGAGGLVVLEWRVHGE